MVASQADTTSIPLRIKDPRAGKSRLVTDCVVFSSEVSGIPGGGSRESMSPCTCSNEALLQTRLILKVRSRALSVEGVYLVMNPSRKKNAAAARHVCGNAIGSISNFTPVSPYSGEW